MTPGRVLPPGPTALWWELRHEYGDGECPASVKEISELVGISPATLHRYLNALEMGGFVSRTWSPGPPPTRTLIVNAKGEVLTSRVKPCGRCWSKPAKGRWCTHCRQLMRHDRVWRIKAINIAKRAIRDGKQVNPTQIHLTLDRRDKPVPLFDRPGDGPDGKGAPGIITILHREGLCPPEFVEAQRARDRGEE